MTPSKIPEKGICLLCENFQVKQLYLGHELYCKFHKKPMTLLEVEKITDTKLCENFEIKRI